MNLPELLINSCWSWLWEDYSAEASGVAQLQCQTCIMSVVGAVLAQGLLANVNPGSGVRQTIIGCWSQHPLGLSLLKGAVISLGSNYHLLPVNSWSSPSLLYQVCHICSVVVSHLKIFAMCLTLGRLFPAASVFSVVPFKHPTSLWHLDDRMQQNCHNGCLVSVWGALTGGKGWDGGDTWYNIQMHYDYQGGLPLVTKTESDASLIKKHLTTLYCCFAFFY